MKLRLLLCRVCSSIDEIPDFQGEPWDDFMLEDIVAMHHARGGHDGPNITNLFDVEEELWAKPDMRDAILKQMKKKVELFEPQHIAIRNNYKEDAAKCFSRHHRQVPCIDWHAQHRRIGNPIRENFKDPNAAVYLCDFCPVASHVMTEQRKVRGDYDPQPGETD